MKTAYLVCFPLAVLHSDHTARNNWCVFSYIFQNVLWTKD